eukprot:gene437-13_t
MTKDNNLLGKFHLDGIPPAPRGVPQIQVTFDVDANAILNVSAADKGTGKSSQITITNEKGRLSQAEIDRMVSEAEKFAAEDQAHKEKIEAKNGLENYCFSMRNSLDEPNLKDKFEAEDKEAIENAVKEALDWLEKNQMAEKDEFDAKQKEVEAIANPIMMKVYQAGGAPGGMPGGMPGGEGGMPDMGGEGGAGPSVEEDARVCDCGGMVACAFGETVARQILGGQVPFKSAAIGVCAAAVVVRGWWHEKEMRKTAFVCWK